MTFRVLVVEDEEVASEAHAAYVGRVPDFEIAGLARTARAAADFLAADDSVDLILLDMHLPDGHGLGLLRHLRAAGHACDVIAVTSARDLDVVKHAVAHGVVAYLIKPFTFAAFRVKLDRLRDLPAPARRAAPARGPGRRGCDARGFTSERHTTNSFRKASPAARWPWSPRRSVKQPIR